MAKNIENLAKKLGATVVGTIPEHSAGAFGIAALVVNLHCLADVILRASRASRKDLGGGAVRPPRSFSSFLASG
jgi:hypothetical protein